MIEFRKGEKWCRWNGKIMSPKELIKQFGTDDEVSFEKGWIIVGDTIYTDKPIGKILLVLGESYGEPEPYDNVLSGGYGWKDHCWEEKLAGNTVFSTSFIEHLVVKPYDSFAKDFPKFNRKKHDAFYNELDKYYEEKFGRK